MARENSIGDFLDKVPPQDLEAERCVLGSILLVNEQFDSVIPLMGFEAFYMDAHRRIFQAFRSMYDAGSRGIDAVTLREELQKRKELDDVGGVQYLIQLLETVPHAAHAEYYAGIVRNKWVQRRLIEAATEILKRAYHATESPDELLVQAEARIAAISDEHIVRVAEMPEVVENLMQVIVERIDTEGRSGRGLPTGFLKLDDKINGLCQDNAIVLAARPSMGKSALVGNIATAQARAGQPGLFVSLEMSASELAERMLCEEAKIDGHKLKTGSLDEIDHYEFGSAAGRMKAWKLLIDDEADQTCSHLCAKIRRAHRVQGIRWVIIDYLQLVGADDIRAPREQQVSQIIRRLKILAKQLHIPIIILAQLNRGIESREDKRPRLSDLRESGAIEQDADIVMFLHRPEAYDPEDRPGEADLIVAKNRHGETGTIAMTWAGNLMRFRDKQPIENAPNDF